MKLTWAMIQPIQRRLRGTLGKLILAPFAILAYTGLLIAPGIFLIPVQFAHLSAAKPPSSVIAMLISLGVLTLVAARVGGNARAIWRTAGTVSMDHTICLVSCILWAVAAVFITIMGA